MKAPRTKPLLVEIGCEEIPARFLDGARDDFGRSLLASLAESRLLPEQAPPSKWYSTPRRLTVWVPEVLVKQPDQVEEIVGPPVRVAFDEAGKPTKAAESFAAKNGVKVQDLGRVATPKGDYLSVKKTHRGKVADRLLPEIIASTINGLSFPKTMYWVAKNGLRFVRPIRWILALLGEGGEATVVPVELVGVKSSNVTFGHRALECRRASVRGFEDYARKLRRLQVEFDPENRRRTVLAESHVLLEGHWRRVEDPALLEWIVNSTEWPSAIRGGFDKRFLHLPREILITVMRDRQKYFAVEDDRGQLQPCFIAILNVDRDSRGLIRQGHERVLAARFADAEFFWDADQRESLSARTARLARVTYQAELGSYADKVGRMQAIAQEICPALEERGILTPQGTAHVLRAIALSKCDLTTQMVQEFTELQGVVGGLYAEAQGEPAEVAQAIYDHYKPEGLEDSCPRSSIGAVVSLADKLDSVVAGFAIGREPTGSSDPFGLRRQGNGIVKVLVEHSFPLAVKPLIQHAIGGLNVEWKRPQHEVFGAVVGFLEERLKFFLETGRKLRYDTVRAVLAAGWESPIDAMHRAEALEEIRGSGDFVALSVAAKRIKNILAKSATASDWRPGEVDASLLEAGPEQGLFEAFLFASVEAGKLALAGEVKRALEVIASLRPPVDRFFDKVLVMCEDAARRENRLRLLAKLDALFSGIAQFAEIAA